MLHLSTRDSPSSGERVRLPDSGRDRDALFSVDDLLDAVAG